MHVAGERIRQAREFLGLSQEQFAERVGVKQEAISGYENGLFQPGEQVLHAIALATGFPPSFFARPPLELPEGSLLFRKRSRATKRSWRKAYRLAQLLVEMALELLPLIEGVTVRLPRLIGLDPEEAAAHARSALGLSPETLIRHLTRSLERAGILVLRLPPDPDIQDVDGFSTWVGESRQWPVIVITSNLPGDRLRFTLAHELGHLMLHIPRLACPREIELTAQRFAGALLLLAQAFRDEFPLMPTLDALMLLKARWGVSLQALLLRARDLRCIPEHRLRLLYQQISSACWRVTEPGEFPVEHPRLLSQMAEIVYGKPVRVEQLARTVGFPVRLTARLLAAQYGQGSGNGVGPGDVVFFTGRGTG